MSTREVASLGDVEVEDGRVKPDTKSSRPAGDCTFRNHSICRHIDNGPDLVCIEDADMSSMSSLSPRAIGASCLPDDYKSTLANGNNQILRRVGAIGASRLRRGGVGVRGLDRRVLDDDDYDGWKYMIAQ